MSVNSQQKNTVHISQNSHRGEKTDRAVNRCCTVKTIEACASDVRKGLLTKGLKLPGVTLGDDALSRDLRLLLFLATEERAEPRDDLPDLGADC